MAGIGVVEGTERAQPPFMPISCLMGPFTTAMDANELVELWSAVSCVAASARITGKKLGSAPAMTALTATFSTVYSQYSCV